MADLKAEQILSAIETTLTGLATTGANVERGVMYGIDTDNLPALRIIQGADEPEIINYALTDSVLTIVVKAIVNQTATVETTLNQIRKEVHTALFADLTIGGLAIDTTWSGASQPLLSSDGSKPWGEMDLTFDIKYRHSTDDPSTG